MVEEGLDEEVASVELFGLIVVFHSVLHSCLFVFSFVFSPASLLLWFFLSPSHHPLNLFPPPL